MQYLRDNINLLNLCNNRNKKKYSRYNNNINLLIHETFSEIVANNFYKEILLKPRN